MDYAFSLLTLKSSEKWRSPLFGATFNFNDQILPYGILFLTFIKGIQAVRIDFFILKVANIRCFILIAVDIFHNIIRK
jgi:hypothetical protein